jgi:hypothetical protein
MLNYLIIKDMKKLFLPVIVALSMNVFGQNPISSEKYIDYKPNDSMLYASTIYTYNSLQQLTKEIIAYDTSNVDSIITTYDANDRIISTESYRNNVLYYSKTWNYDVPNKQIDYYERALLNTSGTFLDTVWYVIYKGVKNFVDVEKSFSNLLFFMETEIELRNCDSMLINYYDTSSHAPKLVMRVFPYYKNGKPDSVKMVFIPGLFGDVLDTLSANGIDITDDIVLTLITDYDDNKLMTINGKAVITIANPLYPTPPKISIPLPDFIVLENKYDSKDRLIETKIEMKMEFILPLFDNQYLGGTKLSKSYDWYNNVFCEVLASSEDGTTWEIESKTYYEYDIEYIFDIELISLILPNADTVGNTVNIEVILRNKSLTTTSQNITITASIKEIQGVPITITEIIPPITAFTEIVYTFSQSYIVPNVEYYGICVFIDSQDTIPENDTICSPLIKTDKKENSIKNINGVNISVSQNIPNPASDVALFKYTIPTDGKVQFTVYSISGQVLYIHTEDAKSGENALELSVSHLASGMYFYAMEFDGKRIVKKMSVGK